MSQPFEVAEVFTGYKGKFVPLKETISGFKRICDGELDKLPEQAFFMVGPVEEVYTKAEQLMAEVAREKEREASKGAGKTAIRQDDAVLIQKLKERAKYQKPLQRLTSKGYQLQGR